MTGMKKKEDPWQDRSTGPASQGTADTVLRPVKKGPLASLADKIRRLPK